MAIVTALTAERMLEIEAASIIDGTIVGSNLILIKHDGSTLDAGNVRGPQGLVGPQGITGPPGPSTGIAGGVLSGTYPNPGFAEPFPITTLPLMGAWTAADQPDSIPVYYKNQLGEVTVEGCLRGGGTEVWPDQISELPEGFRPTRNLAFIMPRANANGIIGNDEAVVAVKTDGKLLFNPMMGGSGNIFSLCGIRFRAA